MKKFKKIISMGLVAVMAMSVMSMSGFAAETEKTAETKTIVEGMIDYSIYDSDMVYIQEHADKVAAYNAMLKSRASIGRYNEWSWSQGIYSTTSRSAAGISINYYFVPTTSSMYFNAEVTGTSVAPSLAVNKLNNDGSLTYVGSYDIRSTGNETYEWSNYRRALNAGQKYVFSLWSNSGNWSYASLDIYKSAM